MEKIIILVGFIIKPLDDIENNIINGDEIVNDNQKLYPQINNTGLSGTRYRNSFKKM